MLFSPYELTSNTRYFPSPLHAGVSAWPSPANRTSPPKAAAGRASAAIRESPAFRSQATAPLFIDVSMGSGPESFAIPQQTTALTSSLEPLDLRYDTDAETGAH